MTELSGHVEDFGLEALIRFLAESGRNGCLKISREAWIAEVFVDQGRVAASIGEEHAEAALDLIALTLADGEFVYSDCLPGAHLDGGAGAIQLQRALERVAAQSPRASGSALLSCVPRVASIDEETRQREVAITRAELAVLLDVNGRRSVEQILTEHRSVRSVHALTRLSELGVIELEASTHANHRPPPVPNAEPPRRSTRRVRQLAIRDLLWTALVCVLAALGISAVVHAVRVDGEGMLPGLQPGQLLLINRAAYFHVEGSPLQALAAEPPGGAATRYLFGGPRRGDVAVVQSPALPNNELILRIIAVPGDTLRIEQGTLFVDDDALAEQYMVPAGRDIPGDGQPVRVPDGRYFVLGDDQAQRQDSGRGWFVRVDDLVGRVWLSFWPPTLWGAVAQPVRPVTPSAEISTSPSSPVDSVPALTAIAEDTAIAPPSPTTTPPTPAPTELPTNAALPAATVLLDGAISSQPGWPGDAAGPVSLNGSEYRMTVQAPNNFIAVAAPVVGSYANVIVSATFHKIGGPSGGGYGIIVRDQTPELRDGVAQTGRFYVAEIGDRGEIGVWRREDDRWVDLLPWTRSDAVHQGTATNELTVQVEGERLTVLVNGSQQATLLDAVLPPGGLGAFVGGDYNQVVLDRFTVQVPARETTP